MKGLKTLATGAAVICLATAAHAQSNVTLYGVIDEYVNYIHGRSGTTVKSLEDGAWLRSRIGVCGQEDLGDGDYAKFQMERGFRADTGTQADSGRFFDRQAWVGLGSASIGQVRAGRQNGPIQTHGGYVDYTARDLGSIINNFGAPSRYDNDFGYLSPRHGRRRVRRPRRAARSTPGPIGH